MGVVQDGTTEPLAEAGLDPFAEVRKSWTGVVMNWPPAAVMARNTTFDPEGTSIHGMHEFTVKFGVNGADPDQVADDAIAYMKAIDAALTAATGTWLPAMSKVFVRMHDYGPLFQLDGKFGKFPELQLEVETYEV